MTATMPWVARLLAAVAAGSGLLTLLGWWADMPGLLRPLPGLDPMRPIAAAWLVACGTAAALLGTRWRSVARVLAAAVLLAALWVLVVYVLEHNLERQFGAWGFLPAPAAAFGMLMIACGVLLVSGLPNVAWWQPPAVALCAAGAFVPLESLCQYLPGGSPGDFPGADIPPVTAIVMVPLAASVVLAAVARRESAKVLRIEWFSAFFTAGMAAALFVTWIHLENRDWRERKMDTAQTATLVADALSARISAQSDALRRISERWSVYGELTRDQWLRDTAAMAADLPGWRVLHFLDDSGAIRWQYTLPGEDARQAELPDLWSAMLAQSPQSVVAHGDRIFYVSPVIAGARLHGYLVSESRLGELLRLSAGPMRDDFGLAVYRAGAELLHQGPEATGAAMRQEAVALIGGERWSVVAWPKPQYLLRLGSVLPETMLLLGLAALAAMVMNFVLARRSALSSQAAQALSRRLVTTMESLTDGFLTFDRGMVFTFVNAEAEKLLERPRGELLGRPAWTMFPEAVGTPFQLNAERALREHCTVFFEEYYAPLGKWINVKLYPNPDGLAVYMQDVTLLRRSRDALRERERELTALAESMPQIVWMTDPAGHVTYVNSRWSEFTGLTAERAFGDAWIEYVHPDDLTAVQQRWSQALASGSDHSVEFRARAADGRWRWMLSRAVRFHDDAGRVVKWIGTVTDIHDLKLQAEVLRESNERFMLVTRATNDGIWELDVASGQVWLSESFLAIYGSGEGNLIRLDQCAQRIHDEDRHRVRAELDEAVRSGAERWSAQYRVRRSNGRWATVLNQAYVQRDPSGAAVRVVGSMADITDRLALEEQLRQSQRLETVGHLTGGVAHDFNNLLTVILGNGEALEEELQSQPQLQALAHLVVQAAERGAELTQRLLAFSRKQALEPSTVDVEAQLGRMEPLLRRTLGEHIDIRLIIAPALWPAHVDRSQLDSAVLNLCVNARDAMPHGGSITIEACNTLLHAGYAERAGIPPGDYVLLSVSDTGSGIRPEHMPHLFEPFFTTKEKGKGTGLGLPMVYGFMKQSGGHIEVDSEWGKGTSVKLYLPRAACAPSETAEPAEPPASEPAAGAILLVEDDPLVRGYGAGQLRSLGYRVVDVSTGQQALEALGAGAQVDLLFTDVVMPGMSGPQLAERALQIKPGLAVLYTSGYTDNALMHHGTLEAGVQLLRKPYVRRELAREVRIALGQRRAGADAAAVS